MKKPLENKQYLIDEYLTVISNNCEKKIPAVNNLYKIENDNIIVPTIHSYNELTKYNYNVQQLKLFAKNYKLKISGNKKELITRIYIYLYLSSYIIKIQKNVRGLIQKKYNFSHGPGFKNRKLCNNATDFVTMEELSELSNSQFFSYKDVDGFIYGFDLVSIYNLIFKNKNGQNGKILNPYNRNEIPDFVNKNIKTLIRLSKILRIEINLSIINDYEISKPKSVELSALSLFQEMDSLGNYTDSRWFLSLNRNQLIKFTMELIDIWNYRAQLTLEIKRNICPPNGMPFANLHVGYIQSEPDIHNVQKHILNVCEKFVNTGINNDSRTLGSYYVLGALCMVSQSAATSLPWLFQSFSVF